MAPFIGVYRFCECHKREQRGDHDDGIHTGPLPIASSQMQPHAEYVERQRHRYSVDHGNDARISRSGSTEKEIAADRREQEYAVIQVMAMRVPQKQI